MLALFPKVSKIPHPKALKIDAFDYPTWHPLFRERRRISTYN